MNHNKRHIFAVGLFPSANKEFLRHLCQRFRVFTFEHHYFEPKQGPGPEIAENLLSKDEIKPDNRTLVWATSELLRHAETTLESWLPGNGQLPLQREEFEAVFPGCYAALCSLHVFKKIVAQYGVDMVVCNADYSGLRRPIIMEARKLGIPTLDIEHGFFGAAPTASALKSGMQPPSVFCSDFVNLDNELEKTCWQSLQDASHGKSNSQFLTLGTPNDHSFDANISRTEALQRLGLAPNRFTITVASTWMEAHIPAVVLEGQMQHVYFFKDVLRVLARLQPEHDLQIILKMHPAFTTGDRTAWEGALEFLQKYAEAVNIDIALTASSALSEIIAASDLLIYPNASSLLWEYFIAGKPGIVYYTPVLYEDYYDAEKLNSSNALFRAGCARFAFDIEQLQERIEHYLQPDNYVAFEQKVAELRGKYNLQHRSLEEKCRNICKWIAKYLEGEALNASSPADSEEQNAQIVQTGEAPLPRRTLLTAVRPDLVGVYVAVICDDCGYRFEQYLPTVAGMGLSRFNCPDCGIPHEVWPEDFLEALNKYLSGMAFDAARSMNDVATRVTQSWYRHPTFAASLTYENINLGEPTERRLYDCVSLGLRLNTAKSGDES